jgi:hypothetical protein
MTKEHIASIEEYYKGKNGKVMRDESTETRRSIKSAWITREIISQNKRVVTTPAGTFFVIEENGRTTQLRKIDHLSRKDIIKVYFDFFSCGLFISRP